jgi:hypothetical protein
MKSIGASISKLLYLNLAGFNITSRYSLNPLYSIYLDTIAEPYGSIIYMCQLIYESKDVCDWRVSAAWISINGVDIWYCGSSLRVTSLTLEVEWLSVKVIVSTFVTRYERTFS